MHCQWLAGSDGRLAISYQRTLLAVWPSHILSGETNACVGFRFPPIHLGDNSLDGLQRHDVDRNPLVDLNVDQAISYHVYDFIRVVDVDSG